MNAPKLGIPNNSENISQIYLVYILGYILDILKIYLGYTDAAEIGTGGGV
jgi:hypothetical protein